jgi:hypothetical protein
LRSALHAQMAFGHCMPMPELTTRELRGTMGSIVLLDLMGGVALLLWGLYMVLSVPFRCLTRREDLPIAWLQPIPRWRKGTCPDSSYQQRPGLLLACYAPYERLPSWGLDMRRGTA